jgi:hypothetical protein
MVFDAGRVVFYGDADLSAVETAVQNMDGYAKQLDTAFQNIDPVLPPIDISQVVQSLDTVETTMADAFREAAVVTPKLDPAPLTTETDEAVAEVGKKIDEVPDLKIGVDSSQLAQASELITSTVGQAVASVPDIQLHMDDSAVLSDTARVQAALEAAFDTPIVIAPTFDGEQVLTDAAALTQTLDGEWTDLPPIKPTIDTTEALRGAADASTELVREFERDITITPKFQGQEVLTAAANLSEAVTETLGEEHLVEVKLDKEAATATVAASRKVADDVDASLEDVQDIVVTLDGAHAVAEASDTSAAVNDKLQEGVHPIVPAVDKAPAVAEAERAAAEINTSLHKISPILPHLDLKEIHEGLQKTEAIANSVTAAISKISGGRINIDVAQVETAGDIVKSVLSGITTAAGSTAAAVVASGAVIVGAFLLIREKLEELGEKWETTMRRFSVAMGATGAELEHFHESLVKIAQVTGKGPEEIAGVLGQLATRLPVANEELEKLTINVLKFAKVTGQDATDAAVKLSQIMTALHEPTENAAKDMDTLLRVTQDTFIPIAQLEDQMKGRLAPTLHALGLSFEEIAGLIGNMAKQGDAGRLALSAFNRVLTEARAAGEAPTEAFKRIVQQLQDVGDESTSLAQHLQKELGPSYTYLASLVKNGAIQFDESSGTIKTSSDTVVDAAGRIKSGSDVLQASLNKLGAQFIGLGEQVAKSADGMKRQFASGIDNVTAALSGFIAFLEAADRRLKQMDAENEERRKQRQKDIDAAGGVLPFLTGGQPAAPPAAPAAAEGEAGPSTAAADAAVAGSEKVTAAAKEQSAALNKVGTEAKGAAAAYVDLEQEASRVATALKNVKPGEGAAEQIQALLEQQKALKEYGAALDALPPHLRAVVEAQMLQAAADKDAAINATKLAEAAAKARDASIAKTGAANAESEKLTELAGKYADDAKQLQALAEEERSHIRATTDFSKATDDNIKLALRQAQALRDERAARGEDTASVDEAIAEMQHELTARLQSATAAEKNKEALRILAAARGESTAASDADAAASAKDAEATNQAATAAEKQAAAEAGRAGAMDASSQQAARLGAENEKYGSVISGLSPLLSLAEAAQLKLLQQQKEAGPVLDFLQEKFGITAEQAEKYRARIEAGGEDGKRAAEQMLALGKGIESINFASADADATKFFEVLISGMDAGTRNQYEFIKRTEGADAALQALVANGVPGAEKLTKAIGGTKDQMKEATDQAEAYAKGLAGFQHDEMVSNAKKAFDALTAGWTGADLAQAKATAGTLGYIDAVRSMADSAPGGFAQVEAAINGDTAALKALELQAARTKAALDSAATYKATGIITPAPAELPDATKIRDEAFAKADEGLADLSQKTDMALAHAAAEYADQLAQFAERASEIKATLQEAQQKAAEASADSQQKLSEDLAKAGASWEDSLAKYQKGVKEAWRTYNEAVTQAKETLSDSETSIGKTFDKSMEDITKSEKQALEQNIKAHEQIAKQLNASLASALKQQSDAQQAFNDQQNALLNSASIAAENARIASYGFTDSQSIASNKRAAEIQAAGTAGLQQVASAQSLNKAMAASQKAAADAQTAAADASAAADKAYQDKIEELAKKRDEAAKKAQEDLQKAREKYEKTVAKATADRDRKLEDLSNELDKAAKKLKQAQDEAYKNAAKREKKIAEDLLKAQQKYQKDMEKLDRDKEKAATKYQDHIDDIRREDAKQRRKFMNDKEKAQKEFDRAVKLLNEGLGMKVDKVRTVIEEAKNKFGNTQTFQMTGLNIQETNIDFLHFAHAELDKAMATAG